MKIKLLSHRIKPSNFSSVRVKIVEFASIFGQKNDDNNNNETEMQQSSLNDIANARSRFASVVDAQEYTKARVIVQALELREESTTRSSSIMGRRRKMIYKQLHE